MTATSTIEPVAPRLTQGWQPSELADWDTASAPRNPGIVYLDAAGSARGHHIAVPDDVIRKIHGVSGRPMIIRVLSQQMRMGSYLGHANLDGSHTSGFDVLYLEPQPPDDYGTSTATTLAEWRFEPLAISSPTDEPEAELHPSVRQFAAGVDGAHPSDDKINTAVRIIAAALERTVDPEFSVDDDGALSIDLRLSNGLRLLAELPVDGTLDVGTYDDRNADRRAREIAYFPNATAADLIALL